MKSVLLTEAVGIVAPVAESFVHVDSDGDGGVKLTFFAPGVYGPGRFAFGARIRAAFLGEFMRAISDEAGL